MCRPGVIVHVAEPRVEVQAGDRAGLGCGGWEERCVQGSSSSKFGGLRVRLRRGGSEAQSWGSGAAGLRSWLDAIARQQAMQVWTSNSESDLNAVDPLRREARPCRAHPPHLVLGQVRACAGTSSPRPLRKAHQHLSRRLSSWPEHRVEATRARYRHAVHAISADTWMPTAKSGRVFGCRGQSPLYSASLLSPNPLGEEGHIATAKLSVASVRETSHPRPEGHMRQRWVCCRLFESCACRECRVPGCQPGDQGLQALLCR